MPYVPNGRHEELIVRYIDELGHGNSFQSVDESEQRRIIESIRRSTGTVSGVKRKINEMFPLPYRPPYFSTLTEENMEGAGEAVSIAGSTRVANYDYFNIPPVAFVSQSDEVPVSSNNLRFEIPRPTMSPPTRRTQNDSPSKRRALGLLRDVIRKDSFPKPNFSDWSSSRKLEQAQHNWHEHVEFRQKWIFDRREKEGFNRRNVAQFSVTDLEEKITKRKKEHELDNEVSKFYDWCLGGTEWILRLEYVTLENEKFLICRHIHKPSDKEVFYEIRYWTGSKFKQLYCLWSEYRDNESNIRGFFDSTVSRIRSELEDD